MKSHCNWLAITQSNIFVLTSFCNSWEEEARRLAIKDNQTAMFQSGTSTRVGGGGAEGEGGDKGGRIRNSLECKLN